MISLRPFLLQFNMTLSLIRLQSKPVAMRINSMPILHDLAFGIEVPNVDFGLIINEFTRFLAGPLNIQQSHDHVLVFKQHFGLEQSNINSPQGFKKNPRTASRFLISCNHGTFVGPLPYSHSTPTANLERIAGMS